LFCVFWYNKGKKFRRYKRLTQEQKEMIFKLFSEKMELIKIAKAIEAKLRIVQYLLKKRKEYKNCISYF